MTGNPYICSGFMGMNPVSCIDSTMTHYLITISSKYCIRHQRTQYENEHYKSDERLLL